jgi:hypothetical protein
MRECGKAECGNLLSNAGIQNAEKLNAGINF